MQPDTEFAPDAVYRPASQSKQDVTEPTVFMYFPGAQNEQDDDPELLKPESHEAHVSVAPVE